LRRITEDQEVEEPEETMPMPLTLEELDHKETVEETLPHPMEELEEEVLLPLGQTNLDRLELPEVTEHQTRSQGHPLRMPEEEPEEETTRPEAREDLEEEETEDQG
jgi:hypothetical protein